MRKRISGIQWLDQPNLADLLILVADLWLWSGNQLVVSPMFHSHISHYSTVVVQLQFE